MSYQEVCLCNNRLIPTADISLHHIRSFGRIFLILSRVSDTILRGRMRSCTSLEWENKLAIRVNLSIWTLLYLFTIFIISRRWNSFYIDHCGTLNRWRTIISNFQRSFNERWLDNSIPCWAVILEEPLHYVNMLNVFM